MLYSIKDKPLFKVGIWNGERFTLEDLSLIVSAFNKLDFKPAVKIHHYDNSENVAAESNPLSPALGYISNLRLQGDALVGNLEGLPKKVWNAIKTGAYKELSIELAYNYVRDGKLFPRVLTGVALLGSEIPAVADLGQLAALYEENRKQSVMCFSMSKDSLIGGNFSMPYSPGEDVDVSKILDDLKALVEILQKEEMPEGMPEGMMSAFKDGGIQGIISSYKTWAGDFNGCVNQLKDKPNITNPEAVCAWVEKQSTGSWPGKKKGESKMENDEKDVKKKDKEMADSVVLKQKQDELQRQNKEMADRLALLEKENKFQSDQLAEREIKSFLAEQKNAGKILPKSEGALIALFQSVRELPVKTITFEDNGIKSTFPSAFEALKSFVSGLPKLSLFREVGAGNTPPSDSPDVQVDAMVREYALKNKTSYREAFNRVLQDNPSLKYDYFQTVKENGGEV